MFPPERLLAVPAPEGVRWLALARLHHLVAARQRLDDPDDINALHDFRVALRRFRSLLRTYREILDSSITPKIRHRLGRLATAAGSSRDIEVSLNWLHEQVKPGPSNAAGIKWVEAELERDRIKGDRRLQHAVERNCDPVVEQLQRALHSSREAAVVVPLRIVTARALLTQANAVQETLEQARAAGDPQRMHQVRIAAKRLRYALEPLVDERVAPAGIRQTARAEIAQLELMQQALGDLNDELAFEQWLAGAESGKRARGRAEAAFIKELRRRLARQAERRFRTLDGSPWRRRLDRIILRAHTIADRLVLPLLPAARMTTFDRGRMVAHHI